VIDDGSINILDFNDLVIYMLILKKILGRD